MRKNAYSYRTTDPAILLRDISKIVLDKRSAGILIEFLKYNALKHAMAEA